MIFCVSPEPYLDIHGYNAPVVEPLLDTLIEMGVGGISFDWMWRFYRGPDDAAAWLDRARVLVPAAHRLGLKVSLHGPPGGDISAVEDETRAAAIAAHRQALTLIAPLTSDFVYVIHPETACPPRQPGDDQARERMCRESLAELVPLARQCGARLAIENMRHRADNPNRTGMYTDQLMSIIRDLDSQTVGICFDVGHAYISEKEGLYPTFARNASRIIHIHLADNHGVDDEHLEPGEGGINWPRFCQGVQSSGFAGMWQLEVKLPAGDDPLAFYQRNRDRVMRWAVSATQ